MAETVAEMQVKLAALRARRQTTAGISATTYGDQSTSFNGEDLDKAIASLEQRINIAQRGTSTRFAATSKGC